MNSPERRACGGGDQYIMKLPNEQGEIAVAEEQSFGASAQLGVRRFEPFRPFGNLKGMTESRLGPRAEVVRGTLEMLTLTLLNEEPMHGWGLSLKLRDISRDVFDVNQGSLYPALQAMLRRGWIRAEWRASDNNRRARYYRITVEGRKQLEAEIAEWQRTSAAVNRVLRYAFPGV
jgi:PadR family transcriptional regulator PadR